MVLTLLHKLVTNKIVVNPEPVVKIHLIQIKVEDLIIKMVNLLTTILKQQIVRIIKVVTNKILTVNQTLRLPIKIIHLTRIKMVRVIKQLQIINHKVTQMKTVIHQLNQVRVVKIKVKTEVQLIQPVN